MSSLGSSKYEWLPHLKEGIPIEARHNRTSLYTIALEGWRRGLSLSFHNIIDEDNQVLLKYRLKSNERVHYFDESSGDKNTKEAFSICNDKYLTSQYLKKAQVPIPQDIKAGPSDSIEEMMMQAGELTYPLVVKPTDESSGRGVITNIQNEHQLRQALHNLRHQQSYQNILIQEHIHGEEVRIYVLADQVLAATNRIPANVIGDGKLSIAQLIEQKNKTRKKVPHLYFRPIIIDSTLRKNVEEQGYTLETVLEKGKRLFVRKVSNISAGGDPIDVTDQLTKEQKSIAVAATKAIPGLAHAGVDMIIPEGSRQGVIIEINTRPGIGSHLFPIEGKARDIPKALIDYYFPETKSTKRKENVYFDLQAVFDHVTEGYVTEMTLQQVPSIELHSSKWLIDSKLEVGSLYDYLRKLIIDRKLHGHFKKVDNNIIEILLFHEKQAELENIKEYINKRKSVLQISSFTEKNYHGPVQLGFRIIDGLSESSLSELERKYHENKKKLRQHELSIQRLKRRIKLMEQSSSWKITKPLRKLMQVIKNK